MKIEVGQILYLEPIGNAGRRNKEIKPVCVSKVGRYFFELSESHYGRFYIDTMIQDGKGYTPNYIAYFSEQDIKDKRDAENIRQDIYRRILSSKINISKLRQIKELLDSEN